MLCSFHFQYVPLIFILICMYKVLYFLKISVSKICLIIKSLFDFHFVSLFKLYFQHSDVSAFQRYCWYEIFSNSTFICFIFNMFPRVVPCSECPCYKNAVSKNEHKGWNVRAWKGKLKQTNKFSISLLRLRSTCCVNKTFSQSCNHPNNIAVWFEY